MFEKDQIWESTKPQNHKTTKWGTQNQQKITIYFYLHIKK